MSTPIKNTLFRFVSLRAPQLTNEEKQNQRFIFRNDKDFKGFFDDIIAVKPAEKTKWQAMKDACASFPVLSLDEIKNLDEKCYRLGEWLSINKSTLIKKDLDEKTDGITAIQDSAILIRLWDNLFYQTLTQKDFYAKEALIQLLTAHHVLTFYDRVNFEPVKKLVHAKVVYPKVLFVEKQELQTSANKANDTGSRPTVASDEMMRQQKKALATLQKEQFIQLTKELKKVESKYVKERQLAFEKAQKDHLEMIKPLKEEYEAKLEEARKAWCAVRDPQATYDPKDPCQQPAYVPVPAYPEFNFEFREALDPTFLETNLSETSYQLLIEMAENQIPSATAENKSSLVQTSFYDLYDSFESLQGQLVQEVSTQQELIQENTVVQENSSVVIGGLLIPASTPIQESFQFTLCPKPISLRKYFNGDLSITLPDDSWNLSKFEYTLEKTSGNFSNHGAVSYQASRVGTTLYLSNIDLGSPTTSNEAEITAFKATITFTNGKVFTLEVLSFNLHQCFTGTLIDTNPDDETANNGTNDLEVFIPSGFGVKQLGIADYKKVEQTTQGYVEGDVSHIENIMAREYKERTTHKLRKNEITQTSSQEKEHEKLSDTTSTKRFEMQNEVADILQENKDSFVNANVSYAPIENLTLGSSSGFATNTSKENSTRQAIIEAQEVTEKAVDRLVTKIKQERVEKMIEEYEENNTHGYDNRRGDKHVVGVYRWIDKIFKNQILNYGKRLMFEFMIPQPAKLHQLGMEQVKDQLTLMVEPVDPRKYTEDRSLQLKDYSNINETTARFWASKFNVELPSMPAEVITIGKAFAQNKNYKDAGFTDSKVEDIKIPEGYVSQSVFLRLNQPSEMGPANGLGAGWHTVSGGTSSLLGNASNNFVLQNNTISGYREAFPVAYFAKALHASSATVELKCKISTEYKAKWQQETFKAIIDAYDEAVKIYTARLEGETQKSKEIKATNPGFYREFENKILRKNCISYLISQNPNARFTYGKEGLTNGQHSFEKYEIAVNASLDQYTSFVKFMEQAFEWEILSYHLYPYYWGPRKDWRTAYQYNESNDPLFRNFMQAGMARVIVSVRPGFEEAVRYYMQTGQIWNGGEVPVIEDPLYLSIVDELAEIKPEKEGKAWWSRVPTAMTILQAQSIGLKVDQALPYNDDLSDFEYPESVPQSTQLELTEAELGGSNGVKTARIIGKTEGNEGIAAKVVLKRIDGSIQDLTYMDALGNWELNTLPAGRYELLLDADNDFPADTFIVTEGAKEQVVELTDNQVLEIVLVVKRL